MVENNAVENQCLDDIPINIELITPKLNRQHNIPWLNQDIAFPSWLKQTHRKTFFIICPLKWTTKSWIPPKCKHRGPTKESKVSRNYTSKQNEQKKELGLTVLRVQSPIKVFEIKDFLFLYFRLDPLPLRGNVTMSLNLCCSVHLRSCKS